MKQTITIHDIAKEAHVSKTTVSFYLNGHFEKMSSATKERIGEVIAASGYQPNMAARSLRHKPARLLAIVIKDLTLSSLPAFLQGLILCGEERGYQFLLCITEGDPKQEEKCLKQVEGLDADGFFIQPSSHFLRHPEAISLKKPFILLDFSLPADVLAAKEQGCQTARFLIERIEGKQS